MTRKEKSLLLRGKKKIKVMVLKKLRKAETAGVAVNSPEMIGKTGKRRS